MRMSAFPCSPPRRISNRHSRKGRSLPAAINPAFASPEPRPCPASPGVRAVLLSLTRKNTSASQG
jgi:hypothetical protein